MNENPAPAAVYEGLLRLDEWTVLRVHGPDAAAFLQSQLTQDITGLALGQVRPAGYCSAKGRLLASFLAWRMGDEAIGLLCSTDVAAAVVKRLSMYVLRARCRIDVVSGDWVVHGVLGAAIAGAVGHPLPPWRNELRDGAWWLSLPVVEGVPRALLVQSPHAAVPEASRLDPHAWAWLEVSSGVPRIVAATAEQFVPQMVNFELVGGVNFQKGCYPGQEVVARSQYRGTLKRRMHLFATNALATPRQELFHSDDPAQPAGMVVNAASAPGLGSRVLAEVKIAALESGALNLGSPDGAALQHLPLPYPLPDPTTA